MARPIRFRWREMGRVPPTRDKLAAMLKTVGTGPKIIPGIVPPSRRNFITEMRGAAIPSPSPPIQIFFQSFPKTQPTIFSQWIDFPGINNRTPTSMEWMIHNRVSVGISICSLRSEIPRSPSPPPLWRNRGGLRDRTTGWLDHHWERFRKLSRKVSYRVIVFDASYIKLRIDRVSPTGNVATKKSKNCSSFKI